jgi:hypothetical protein
MLVCLLGSGMENRKFLGTAVLVGMLTGHTKNGLNLINAPTLAKDAGIEVSESYEGQSDMPIVTVTVSQGKSVSYSLQGMLHYSTTVIPLIMPSKKCEDIHYIRKCLLFQPCHVLYTMISLFSGYYSINHDVYNAVRLQSSDCLAAVNLPTLFSATIN